MFSEKIRCLDPSTSMSSGEIVRGNAARSRGDDPVKVKTDSSTQTCLMTQHPMILQNFKGENYRKINVALMDHLVFVFAARGHFEKGKTTVHSN